MLTSTMVKIASFPPIFFTVWASPTVHEFQAILVLQSPFFLEISAHRVAQMIKALLLVNVPASELSNEYSQAQKREPTGLFTHTV